ncbi:MAG: DUF6393 family protein [Burkholderiaceae bacterium]
MTSTNLESSMLSEIYATRIPSVATQRADVSGIVSKYLPVGTSRAKTLELIKGLGEGKTDESTNQLVYTTHRGEGLWGNRRDILVKIQFDANNNVESIASHIDKSNNL